MEGGAKRVDVAGDGGSLAVEDLGRGEGDAGGDDAAARLRAALDGCDAEVGQLGLAERREQDVLGFEVAVQHADAVRGLEGPGDLDGHLDRIRPRQGTLVDDLVRQRSPLHELHRQIGSAVGSEAGGEDLGNVGVVRHETERLALPLETPLRRLVDLVEDLDGDDAAERRLRGAVHLPESPAADLDEVDELVGPEVDRDDRHNPPSAPSLGRGGQKPGQRGHYWTYETFDPVHVRLEGIVGPPFPSDWGPHETAALRLGRSRVWAPPSCSPPSPLKLAGVKINPDAAGFDAARLTRIGDHITHRYVEPHKITGAQVLVARHGHVGYFESFGLCDRERNKPV